MVGVVEVEGHAIGLGVRAKVGGLDRIQQVATATIRLMTARRVGEWHEEAASVALDPERAEAQRRVLKLELQVADAREGHLTHGGGWLLVDRREMRLDPRRRIEWPVCQA